MDYETTVMSLAVGLVLAVVIKHIAIGVLSSRATKTQAPIYDFFIAMVRQNLAPILYLAVFLSACLAILTAFTAVLSSVVVAGIAFFGFRFLVAFMAYGVETRWIRGEEDAARVRGLRGVLGLAKVLAWGLGAMLLLDCLNLDVAAAITGLVVGGLVVIMVANGDYSSYLTILVDRPFKAGDFIQVGDVQGYVEEVGFKTTRLRCPAGEAVVMANSDLTKSRLRNFQQAGPGRGA